MKYDGVAGSGIPYSSTRLRYARWTPMIFEGRTGGRNFGLSLGYHPSVFQHDGIGLEPS